MDHISKWDATTVLKIDQKTDEPYVFIILNRPILFTPADFQRLWNHASLRVLVDGGANQWFKFNAENQLDEHMEPPHLLTGDMDSVSEESLRLLDNLKCKRIDTPDQMDTDCTKSLIAIKPYLESMKIKHVLMMTDFGGRIDQLLSQVNTLFKHPLPTSIRVYLRSFDTLAWLLTPGHHSITIPEEFVANEIWCGYIPMNGETCVTTTGLKYDLTNSMVRFGEIISTSNSYSSSNVTIKCDNHLFWTMGTCTF